MVLTSNVEEIGDVFVGSVLLHFPPQFSNVLRLSHVTNVRVDRTVSVLRNNFVADGIWNWEGST